jgi:hypothetical protein
MAKASESRPKWAEEALRSVRPPTPDDLKRRREALARLRKLRKKLDIRPLTTTDLVREIREES